MGETIKEVVDRAYVLDQQIKKSTAELRKLKVKLKLHATRYDTHVIEGSKSKAVFQDSTATTCEPKDLYDYLKKTERVNQFFSLVKVVIGEARKAIGEISFDKISESEEIEYHKVSLKKK
jgi:hypothetical protein